MSRFTAFGAALLCAVVVPGVVLSGCAQSTSTMTPGRTMTAARAVGDATSIPPERSVRERAASQNVTVTVEKALASLPGMKVPSGPLATDPDFAVVVESRDVGVVKDAADVEVGRVLVFYESDLILQASPWPYDLDSLEAQTGEANPLVHMISTPLGRVLAIQGSQQGPRAGWVTPSCVMFNVDGIGYAMQVRSVQPIAVQQLVLLAESMQ